MPGDLVICGDFNCPGVLPGEIDERLLAVINDCNSHQHVNSPTRLDNTLDLIITQEDSLTISNVQVHDVAFSDHRLVSFELNIMIIKASCALSVVKVV